MNRRGFLKLLGLGAIAVPLVKQLGALAIEPEAPAILTYKGVPVVYDQYCNSNFIYFVNERTRLAYMNLLEASGESTSLPEDASGFTARIFTRRGEAPVGSWASVERSRDAFWSSRVHVDSGSQRHFERSLLARSA